MQIIHFMGKNNLESDLHNLDYDIFIRKKGFSYCPETY